VRRSDGLLAGAILATVAGVAFVVAVPGLGVWVLLAALLAFASYAGWTPSRESRAELRAERDGLYAGGVLLVSRSAIRSMRILPRAQKGPLIEIGKRGLSLRVSVRSAKQARELVRAMGRDPREGLARFTVPLLARMSAIGMWGWTAVVCVLALVSATRGGAGLLTFSGLALACAFAISIVLQQTITIGKDGILIETPLRRQFLRYTDIRSIGRLSARTWTGQPLPSPGFAIRPKVGLPIRVHTMHERLREGMYANDHLFAMANKLLRRKATDDAPHVALMRGSRTASEWLGALRATEAGGYRSMVLDTEDLLRVVADPGAPDEARAGAVAALSGRKDEAARTRLRVIAEEVAMPKLRVAIDAALEEDEERLLQALEEVR